MKPILPGATIGILGGGQLGRMFALEARKMGYRVHTYEPSPESPAGQIADREVNRPYAEIESLLEFASRVDVVTYEFENIPTDALAHLEGRIPLRPDLRILHTCQNRRREKEWLSQHGFPVTRFAVISSAEELQLAVEEIGRPSVLKTADFGYDGKGQIKITPNTRDLNAVWTDLREPVGVLEAWVDYTLELSCMVARGVDGQTTTFAVAENIHTNHVLDLSIVPARIPPQVMKRAEEIAIAIAHQMNLVGVLAVEFFLKPDGELLINELAPRPHNSMHYSFDACVTSQFEQHLRAVCGLPLGTTRLLTPVIMRNLLGEVWGACEPPWRQMLAIPGLKLHLYGKREPRAGRKMGHYTVVAPTLEVCFSADAIAQRLLHPV